MSQCRKCNSSLCGDEQALSKKLLGKGEKTFLCINCLAEMFGCSTELLERKIEYYRQSGCKLFAQKD